MSNVIKLQQTDFTIPNYCFNDIVELKQAYTAGVTGIDNVWYWLKNDGGRLTFSPNAVTLSIESATRREVAIYFNAFATFFKTGFMANIKFSFTDEADGFKKVWVAKFKIGGVHVVNHYYMDNRPYEEPKRVNISVKKIEPPIAS